VIQGTFGVIQGTFGVIQGTFGVIQGTFVYRVAIARKSPTSSSGSSFSVPSVTVV
jgi:hypothetical protein